MIIKLAKKQSQSLGLLVCECGFPENNHSDFGEKLCAFDPFCKGYEKMTKIIVIPVTWLVELCSLELVDDVWYIGDVLINIDYDK